MSTPDKDKKILVVGGYGNVGRIISSVLARQFPGRVIVAGRDYQKANTFAGEIDDMIILKEWNIDSPADSDLFDNLALVIVCVEQKNTLFVEQCIQRGIDYIDISASYQFLSQVEQLDADAQQNNSTVILSVGLAPGLTNLLASYGKQLHPHLKHIDLFILLGLGEIHGNEAVLWTLSNLNANFSVTENNYQKLVASFVEGKQTVFSQLGTRTGYRFNFSDQQVLPYTLNLDSVSSWLCFDSQLATKMLNLAKKAGLLNILRIKAIANMLIKASRNMHFGSDYFVIQADLLGSGRDVNRYSISGYGEGKTTGLVAAEVANRLLQSSFPPGVFHIEQLFEAKEFIEAVCSQDSEFKFVSS